MAPPARRARAETSLGWKPVRGKRVAAAMRRWAVSTVEVMLVEHVGDVYIVQSGVVGRALCCLKCETRRIKARTGQREGWPLRAWPTTSFSTPFFCFVNRRVTKVALSKVVKSTKCPCAVSVLTRNVTSDNVKGWVLALGEAAVCSPGRRRKKKPMIAKSAMAEVNGVVPASDKCCISWTGRGFTRDAGGSDLLYPLSCCWRQ